jgi:hypothetical protein
MSSQHPLEKLQSYAEYNAENLTESASEEERVPESAEEPRKFALASVELLTPMHNNPKILSANFKSFLNHNKPINS